LLAKIREQKGATTDFVCAVPFAPFWAPKGWIETKANKIATKIKKKNCRRIQKRD
jgi:hypothetical protein